MAQKYTQDEFVNLLNEKTSDIKLIGDYNGMFINTDFQCNKGHIFSSRPHNILNRLSCPVCSGKLIVRGVNDLWANRPDVAALLQNTESGYVYGVGSHKKESFVCPECLQISHKEICKVTSRGFKCDYCSDGISFPNKILRYILTHLPVDNVRFEWSPDWLKPKRYDGYFELCGLPYVVEMDGGLGHGNKTIYDNVNGLQIDIYKDNLAIQHNIRVIRIDCNYPNIDARFEYIKTNLLRSELSQVIDLHLISWDECLKSALSSNILKAVELYKKQYNILDIASLLQCNRQTVRDWLKQAAKINLCDYSSETSYSRSHKKLPSNTVGVQQIDYDQNIIRTFISVAEAHRQTGINNISAVLNGRQKSAGGFLWRQCTINNIE